MEELQMNANPNYIPKNEDDKLIKDLEKAFQLIADAYLQANFPRSMMNTYAHAENIEEDFYEDEGWSAKITYGVADESHKEEYYQEVFMTKPQFEDWRIKNSDTIFPEWTEI